VDSVEMTVALAMRHAHRPVEQCNAIWRRFGVKVSFIVPDPPKLKLGNLLLFSPRPCVFDPVLSRRIVIFLVHFVIVDRLCLHVGNDKLPDPLRQHIHLC